LQVQYNTSDPIEVPVVPFIEDKLTEPTSSSFWNTLPHIVGNERVTNPSANPSVSVEP
jgi:hypothetical protein